MQSIIPQQGGNSACWHGLAGTKKINNVLFLIYLVCWVGSEFMTFVVKLKILTLEYEIYSSQNVLIIQHIKQYSEDMMFV